MDEQYRKLSLEDIFLEKKFEPENIHLFAEDFPNKTIINTLEKTFPGKIDPKSFILNADNTFLLFKIKEENIYRRSTKAYCYVLDMATNEIIHLHANKIMHARFSPDGEKIAYVFENNLYVFCLDNRDTKQITVDGKWNYIINGNCDWVYEEEFVFSQAYQWSPDSEMIAFYRFDESLVKEYSFPIYDDQYNSNYTYKYPKAGEENSDVTIHIHHLHSENTVPCSIHSDKGYIPKISWSPESLLYIFHLNRHQNKLHIWEIDPSSNAEEIFYTEEDDRYIDFTDDWFFVENRKLIYTSEKSGFRNIYLKEKNKTSIPLTDNQYELTYIGSVDKENGWIYFTAAFPNPMERQLFVVDFHGKQKQLSKNAGWNVTHIDKNKSKIIIENSNIREPATFVEYTIEKGVDNLPTLQMKQIVSENILLKQSLQELKLGQPAFLQIPIAQDKFLNACMLQPTDFDESKKYPVLFCNYGGPGSQMVVNRFGAVTMWQHYLTQEQFILVSVDNTGTGGRGADFKKQTYLQLGKLEIEDQIKAAHFIAKLPYVDSDRIGHWGWSFGGFMSSLAITKGASIFNYAIAIAPVTSWEYYDTIYTERYMRTPIENPQGYEDNTPFDSIENIKGKLLLIHGSADDNVHLQHSMQLSKTLVEKNIPFDMAVYTDKNHRINGGKTPLHLWQKITKWLMENS
ncbi:MAG: S9 family peptidase [Pseudopedobacter saltans]|uniref:S9 family peptidase n=1 Tax=Pseudopedobacter saltans TaxID=151895 RepID=A0A2W5EUI9_9SPHI|nr:MAG: S9 family peptidase [Pseudopedobacter saltans]